ncbi:MAG: hypothetical protein ACYC3I_27300 [Gemmataceae bacterium]
MSCYPEGVPEEDCWLSHARPVWRLEQGRAALIAYHIYRGPGNRYGQIAGVLGRSEFGMEIIVEIAYFVYVIGLSFDKVCLMLRFLQNLPLGKTQVDALLQRLSRHGQHEFDALCTLLANSLVVHSDETRWRLNSVWAFLSEKARLVFFGVHKDAETLKQILDPETFAVQPNGQSQAVSGTNNESVSGARRQTILVSVLESLRLYLPAFTLNGIIEEIKRWQQAGQSCFQSLLQKLGLTNPSESILDNLLPASDG